MSTWYGTVPNHWSTIRLASILREVNEPGEDSLPYLSVSISHGISSHELSDDELNRKVRRSADNTMNKRIRPGDIVFNMMRAWQGAYGAAMVDGMTSPAYIVARPKSDINSKFLERLLRTPAGCNESKCKSHGITDFRLRLYREGFKDIHIPLPPRDEQNQIVRYLDWKVSQINRLINAKRRQIGLLQEQKRAIINAAVTRGGDGWEEISLGNLGNFRKGYGGSRADDAECGVACIRYGDIYRTGAYALETPITRINATAAEGYARVYKSEVLFPLSGETKEDIGMAMVNEIEEDTWCSGDCAVFRSNGAILPKFLVYAVRCQYLVQQRASMAKGDIIVHLSTGAIRRLRILVPPVDVQMEIVVKLNALQSKTERMITAIEQQIAFFHEYRNRLVSDVVTGKLDVRDVVVPGYEVIEETAENEPTEADDIAEDDDE